MVGQLLKPVLVLVIGYLLQLAFAALNVEVDAGMFNALVAAIVSYLLALVGIEGAIRAGFLAKE